MQLRCFAFGQNDPIPPRFRSVNPPLSIIEVPQTAKSLALIMHDPDAVGGDFTHWMVWDMSPTTTEILENHVPPGATQGLNTTGQTGYTGPRPPQGSGRHHYTFELYALDALLDALPTISVDYLRQQIRAHQLASATLIGIVDA